MFGYIYPERIELKIKDYDVFKAYYCGVCISIKKRYKQLNRMTLTYDATFLAILLDSLNENKIIAKRNNCIAHPIKKRAIIEKNNYTDYAADINVLLTYYNLKDDWKDDRSIKKLFLSFLLRKSLKNVKNLYPKKCAIIEGRLREIYVLEKEKCSIPEKVAEPFGRLMEEVLYDEGNAGVVNKEPLRAIGYNIGKWIYLIDAYDDLKDDLKKNKYNPLILKYELTETNLLNKLDKVREEMEFVFMYTLHSIAEEYKKLKTYKNEAILENIFYMGMLRKTENILGIGSSEEK